MERRKHNECLRDGMNEHLLAPDPSISRLTHDAPSAVCDVMFVYIPNTSCFVCENTIKYAVN